MDKYDQVIKIAKRFSYNPQGSEIYLQDDLVMTDDWAFVQAILNEIPGAAISANIKVETPEIDTFFLFCVSWNNIDMT